MKQDQHAFQHLVEDYQSSFLTMAYKFTNHYTDAEDLCQEIFIKVYKALPTYRKKSQLSTWLYRIAVNRCLDWKRRSKSSLFQMVNLSDFSPGLKTNRSTEEEVIYKEKQQFIHQTVYNLKDKYKTIVILYHFNGLSYKEISEILNLPVKTIETRLYRARKQIKDKLMHQGYGGDIIEVQGI
ncbi:RNA polymerase sigma factor [Vallitalea pronyensis]|uniref:RNA polymerase sigma factor n=1 Tax=Vallitalea pronyensis TaxID=1348613 RepID=A0A8J8SF86_9FIRM|nr:RNA polymerase sigma factor [Vallitalea pronyensis]QUI20983.1 RNA polymerase sigma factor [Vallitalea pronyensis]